MLRLLGCAVVSLIFSGSVFLRYDPDVGDNPYTASAYSSMLPFMLIFLFLFAIPIYGAVKSVKLMFSTWFGVFLQIGIYDALLLLLLPLLRKKISARSCAALWFLPNFLYYSQMGLMVPSQPLWVIPISETVLPVLAWVWLIGFSVILIWQVGTHLLFRRKILKPAYAVSDSEILTLWKQEQQDAGLKKTKLRLLYSPAVRTPLSIGLFQRTTRVLLPICDYTPAELHLIFQHELIHICREDSKAKFFLLFCTAVCWFNPFLWIAKRNSANDLELSCDEAVLLHADSETRTQYANLLLKTAGQEQGFTTCLSASASALRYRLKNTVKPRTLTSGALVLGLVCFFMLSTCGYVALAYGAETGETLIFRQEDPRLFHLDSTLNLNNSHEERICTDPKELHAYLSQLRLQTITGGYSFSDEAHSLVLHFDTPNGRILVTLGDHNLEIAAFKDKKLEKTSYYVADGIDWALIDRLLPILPSLKLQFNQDPQYPDEVYASVDTVIQLQDDIQTVFKASSPEETLRGTYGQNLSYASMELEFSAQPLNGFTVIIESWDRQTKTVLTQDDLAQPNLVPLPDYDAHYTIKAALPGPDGTVYETVFRYDLGTL